MQLLYSNNIRFFFFVLVFVTASCGIPKEALKLNEDSLEKRQVQTRKFDTSNEKKVIKASMAALQDMGFNLDESELSLGLLVASKDASAINPGQVAFAVVAALAGAYVAIDTDQFVRASLVTRKVDKGKKIAVRVTFQTTVTNSEGRITSRKAIEDEKLYQTFFEKLSKSLFLEANMI